MDVSKIKEYNERMMVISGDFFTNDYLTPREHKRIGSSVQDFYWENPDMPLCVFDGEVSAKDCDCIRKNSKKASRIRDSIGLLELNLDDDSLNYGTTNKDE